MTWKTIDVSEIRVGDRLRFRQMGTGALEEHTVLERPDPLSSHFKTDRGAFSRISKPFERWEEDKIDVSKIRPGDTVTVEVDQGDLFGTYIITGSVHESDGGNYFVGPARIDRSSVKVLSHTSKNPEWWSWPLVSYDGHIYALDRISSPNRPHHTHGRAYCECEQQNLLLRHSGSNRNLKGVRRAAIIIEDGDLHR